jgi:hypothetical protein
LQNHRHISAPGNKKNNSKKWIANFQRLEIRYNFTGEFVLHVMFVVHGDSSSPNPN